MTQAISNGGQMVYVADGPEGDTVIELSEPQSRIAVRVPHGIAGRAEARFGGKNWAAKHYWREGEPSAEVTVYEFDEPLPAGRVLLHIPISPAGDA